MPFFADYLRVLFDTGIAAFLLAIAATAAIAAAAFWRRFR